MQYIATTPLVNRFGKKYIADANGIITADCPEIASIFESMGFTKLTETPETPTTRTYTKKNAKI